ncbi:MAG: GNAT family N-acetyltransferase [bacterium]
MPAVSDCTRVDAFSVAGWNEAAPVWRSLAGKSPHASFFLSNEWADCWVATFGKLLKPEFLVFEDNGKPAGICALVHRTITCGPIPVRRVYLNLDGEDEADETVLEYNSILCLPGYEAAAADALARVLLTRRGWDEFAARRLAPGPVERALRQSFAALEIETNAVPAPFVDLERLRRSGESFESTLGGGTRRQLRQSVREYSRLGELRLEAASTLSRAMDFFDELTCLHQKSWIARGQPGAFASARFTAFHRALIGRTFAAGSVALLRVTAGSRTIGILYCLIRSGVVHYYQSGYTVPDNNRLSPGLVTLAQSITYCLERRDVARFDFMAGNSRYKQSLSTDSGSVVSLIVRRPTIRRLLVDVLKHARATARNGRKRVALHAR